jgi:Uma2 family endonuclease
MTTTSKLTLEQYLKLPETKPYSEFVDGEVVQKAMPTLAHSIIQHLLSVVFGLYFRTNPIAIGATELRCIIGPPGRELAHLPDFVVIAIDRLRGLAGDRPFYGAPDLAVEILSPDDRMVDVMAKVTFYLENGVRLVWVINPVGRTVLVMATPSELRILGEDDTLDGGAVVPGFSTTVRDILPPAGLLEQPGPRDRGLHDSSA